MAIDKKKAIFLLGGYDLEMWEIKKVLKDAGFDFFDKGLSWDNATLDAYKEEIENLTDKHFYAVELNINEEKDTLYRQYKDRITIIDHHGKYNDQKASLLQVLELLGKEPTKNHELIAANDSRYIDGMKCIGATEDKIEHIRTFDRAVQYCSKDISFTQAVKLAKKDYKQAKEIIKKYIKKLKNKDIVIIKADIKFSAIMDALYFEEDGKYHKDKTILYNEKEIEFFGFEKEFLLDVCKVLKIDLKENDYYYGGGCNGYFGITKKDLDYCDKLKLIAKVKRRYRYIYSSHIFMFPFRFDWVEEEIKNGDVYGFYDEKSISQRLKFEELEEKLASANWRYEQFDIPSQEEMHLAYNEFGYFYDYARDAIYNHHKEYNPQAISSFFRKKDKEGKVFFEGEPYKINILNADGGTTTYTLNIEGVSLRIFRTGIAILSIELNNYEHKNFDDILKINDYGRRIYPQFIGKDKECNTKKAFLPNYIQIGSSIVEDFTDFSYKDVEIGRHIVQLLGIELFSDKKEECSGKFYIQPSLDDRMFVLSWYGDDETVNKLKSCYAYKESDDWYRYVFVDGKDVTVQNNIMKQKLLEDASYDRWSNYGTLYGVTRYSFVCLSENSSYTRDILPLPHMKTMYFQMAIIFLAIRTSILRFSDEVAAIATNKTVDRLQALYEEYLTFYNRLYFKELTHQDQGIELYDIALKQMKISEHIDKLDGKFTKLFDFASLKQNDKETEAVNSLNLVISALGVTGLFVSFYGLGAFDFENSLEPFWWAVGSSLAAGGVALWSMFRWNKYIKDKK